MTRTEINRRWRQRNPEKAREMARRWRAANKDKYRANARRNQQTPKSKAKRREYRVKNQGRIRAIARLYKYGLTFDGYRELWNMQAGRCALCLRRLIEGRATHVDHDHVTGRVRGLLCKDCNTALGVLGDSVESLQRVITYLQEFTR